MHTEIIPYITYLQAHGRKTITIEDYTIKLGGCLTALERAGRPTDPSAITADDIRTLLAILPGNEATRRVKVTVLDRWIKWSTGRAVLPDMALLWNRPQRRRVFIDEEGYRTLLQVARPWERIVLVLGGMMGLRRAEMIDMRPEDVGTVSIRICGKGHGAGMIADQPMAEAVRREIADYMDWRRRNGLGGYPYLLAIPDGHGGVCRREHLDVHVSRMVRRLGQRCGVEVTTHSLRRYYATGIYRLTDHDIDLTRRLMRHADASTTLECYIRPDETATASAVRMIASILS